MDLELKQFEVGGWYYLNGYDDSKLFNHFVCYIKSKDEGTGDELTTYKVRYIDFKHERRGTGQLDDSHYWLFTKLSEEELAFALLLFEGEW